jgi:uncharacterized membrane protein
MGGFYGVLKLLHVLAVVVWIGGAAALGFLTARLVRARDRATLPAVLPQMMRYGQTMGGPSSILVLLSGIGMVGAGRIGFRTLWVGVGFAGIVLHFAFGLTIMRKRMMALGQALSVSPADETRIATAGARARAANVAYLGLLAAVIAVMVLKPTL